MPYFRNPLLDEQDQENGEQSQVRIGGGGDATADPADASGDPSSGGKGLQTGSNFQNLDSYLNVNDAKGFSGQFQDKVQGNIAKGKETTNQAFGGLFGDVNKYSAPGAAQIQAAVADPLKADTAQFKGWTQQEYKGPTSLASNQNAFNQVTGAVQSAQDQAKLAGNASGRFTLLDSFFGKPTYNVGQKSLDNLLVQRGGGLNASALKGSANSLAQATRGKERELQNVASAKRGEVEQSANLARSALGIDNSRNLTGAGALGDFDKGLKERVAVTAADSKAKYDRLIANYMAGTLTDEDRRELGLTKGEGLYNLDLNSYLSPGDTASAQNVASADDYAKYKALNEMGGLTGQLLTDPSQAGSYKGVGVNTSGIRDYLKNTATEYQAADKGYQDQADAATKSVWDLYKDFDKINALKYVPAGQASGAGVATGGFSLSDVTSPLDQFFGGNNPTYGGGTNPGDPLSGGIGNIDPGKLTGQPSAPVDDSAAKALFEKYKADEKAKVKAKIAEQTALLNAAKKQKEELKKQYNVTHGA